MSRRKRATVPLSRRTVPEAVRAKARPPLVVVLGSPAEVVNLLSGCDAPSPLPLSPEGRGEEEGAPRPSGERGEAITPLPSGERGWGEGIVCYQMDLYQANRLREALDAAGLAARVETRPDLWDLPAEYQTAVYMPARGGERELKIDMTEQAFHVVRSGGAFVVWSSYETDPFFPTLLKKVYGRSHETRTDLDTVLWATHVGERPRRRHEVTLQARAPGGPPCRFASRPGVFAYGRFDDGARALVETASVEPGARVLDLGCGCGVVGVLAAQQAGPEGHIAFVDSNVRAAALAEHNARANGVPSFQVFATATVEGPEERSFDLVLANPPYFADNSIARLFVERSHALLKPGGRLLLVTKQPNPVAEMIAERFGTVEAMLRRGYTVLCG